MMREAVKAIGLRRSRVVAVELDGRSVDEPAMLCGGRATVLIAHIPSRLPALASVLDALADALRRGERAWLFTVCGPAPGDTDVSYWLLREGGEVAGEAPPEALDLRAVASVAGPQGWMPLPDGRRAHVELVEPAPAVLVCGAGHVAQALAPVAAGVGFRVVVMDDRPEFADARRFPEEIQVRQLPSFEEAFSGLAVDERSLVVIVTRGHQHDMTVLVQALRTPARYVGLMASRAERESHARGAARARLRARPTSSGSTRPSACRSTPRRRPSWPSASSPSSSRSERRARGEPTGRARREPAEHPVTPPGLRHRPRGRARVHEPRAGWTPRSSRSCRVGDRAPARR